MGNVLTTVLDRKTAVVDTNSTGDTVMYYIADVYTAQCYYAFGSSMPGLAYQHDSCDGYRFGFNTQEKEPELGNGFTSAEFWMYDSRLGRRWNLDPRQNVSYSPYSVLNNNPIKFIDPNGDTTWIYSLNDGSLMSQINVDCENYVVWFDPNGARYNEYLAAKDELHETTAKMIQGLTSSDQGEELAKIQRTEMEISADWAKYFGDYNYRISDFTSWAIDNAFSEDAIATEFDNKLIEPNSIKNTNGKSEVLYNETNGSLIQGEGDNNIRPSLTISRLDADIVNSYSITPIEESVGMKRVGDLHSHGNHKNGTDNTYTYISVSKTNGLSNSEKIEFGNGPSEHDWLRASDPMVTSAPSLILTRNEMIFYQILRDQNGNTLRNINVTLPYYTKHK